MDEGFDTGPIIIQHRFDVEMQHETAYSLEQRTQPVIFRVFQDLLLALEEGKPEGLPQSGGRYISKDMFLELREVKEDDSPEIIERKIRAF
jgi:methionyl-tRNA formyltransferase